MQENQLAKCKISATIREPPPAFGIVMIDDVIDIIHVEATEDMLKMAGVSGGVEYIENQTVFIGFAMICSMTLAATLASSIPLVFHRLRIDPAVATGPFVTTFTDILSVFL
jgi:Mg/Co/Ni transporter MgtE